MEEGKLDPCPVWTDVKTFDGKPFRGLVDILSGGFPCTPFSQAGKREADESANHLFPYFLNVIETVHPTVLFLENVEGLISAKLKGNDWSDPAGTPVLLHVCRELERRGYEATWGIFSASEIGAPHQRKRVFILAHSGSTRSSVRLPEPQQWKEGHAEVSDYRSCRNWPARPGEPQHEWEEPRVVADAHSNESASIRGDNGEVPQVSAEQGQEHCAALFGGEGEERVVADTHSDRLQKCSVPDEQGAEDHKADGQSKWQTESQLGGATNGSTSGVDATINRVDRLRLLGNGVVVETASKAFVTLMRELDG